MLYPEAMVEDFLLSVISYRQCATKNPESRNNHENRSHNPYKPV